MTRVLTPRHRLHLFFLMKIPVPFFRSEEQEEIPGPLNSVPLQPEATISCNLLHKHISFATVNVWRTNYVLICYQCFSLISVLCSIPQLTSTSPSLTWIQTLWRIISHPAARFAALYSSTCLAASWSYFFFPEFFSFLFVVLKS